MTRPLAEIAADLEQLTDAEPEVSHGRADDLLVEAIERLAPYATETVDEAETERLIAAYNRVHKWYA